MDGWREGGRDGRRAGGREDEPWSWMLSTILVTRREEKDSCCCISSSSAPPVTEIKRGVKEACKGGTADGMLGASDALCLSVPCKGGCNGDDQRHQVELRQRASEQVPLPHVAPSTCCSAFLGALPCGDLQRGNQHRHLSRQHNLGTSHTTFSRTHTTSLKYANDETRLVSRPRPLPAPPACRRSSLASVPAAPYNACLARSVGAKTGSLSLS